MLRSFRRSTALLLPFKRPLVLALAGALTSALCFGANLSLMLPVLQLLLDRSRTPAHVVSERLAHLPLPPSVSAWGLRIAAQAPSDPFWSFTSILAVIALIGIVGAAGQFLHGFYASDAVLRATHRRRDRLFAQLIRLPMSRTLPLGTSDHLSRLISDTRLLSAAYDALLGGPVVELLKGVAALGVALLLDWRLTLVSLLAVPLVAAATDRFSRSIRDASRRALEQHGRMVGAAQAALFSIAGVKLSGAERWEEARFARVNQAVLREEQCIARNRAASLPLVEAVSLLVVLSIAAAAAWFAFRRSVDPARFIAVLVALTAAAQSLRLLTRLGYQLAEADAAAVRLQEVMEFPVEAVNCLPVEPGGASVLRASAEGVALPRHRHTLRFHSIGFAYPGRRDRALRDISFQVRHGQMVALLGANGSGKTTLVSLLPRLFDPSEGRIEVDGIDISRVNLGSLRAQIALVPQEARLFQGSIAENIAYGIANAAPTRIAAAARAARADEFIADLPGGYDYELGEFGSGLSAGQRQRIAIARALLRDPAILILDEATSEVDPASECKIQRTLAELRGERTMFVITQRWNSLTAADWILVMQGGEIMDSGTHEQLLLRSPLYSGLASAQPAANLHM